MSRYGLEQFWLVYIILGNKFRAGNEFVFPIWNSYVVGEDFDFFLLNFIIFSLQVPGILQSRTLSLSSLLIMMCENYCIENIVAEKNEQLHGMFEQTFLLPVSAAEFFGIPKEDLQRILMQPNGNDTKTLAFYGDSFLGYQCTCYLQKHFAAIDKASQVGELSIMKSCMVSNWALAFLCDNIFTIDIAPIYTSQLSDHSKGTILEAIIEVSKQKNTDIVVAEKLQVLLAFMHKTLPMESILESFQQEPQENEITNNFNHLSTAFNEQLKESHVNNMVTTLKKMKHKQKLLQEIEKDKQNEKLRKQFNKIIPNIQSSRQSDAISTFEKTHIENATKFEHFGEIVSVVWRSKKKYMYTDEFYSCCGCAKNSIGVNYSAICPRSTKWKNKSSFHTGRLVNIKGRVGGRGGGCGSITGIPSHFDHIPRSAIPTWSCCGKHANAEGCIQDILKIKSKGRIPNTTTTTAAAANTTAKGSIKGTNVDGCTEGDVTINKIASAKRKNRFTLAELLGRNMYISTTAV